MTDPAQESILLAVQQQIHRDETGKLTMQLLAYRRALVEAGIEPLDHSGEELEELWDSCKRVVTAASELLATLTTSGELLSASWR